MAASRSTEPHPLRRLGNDFRGLGPNERIAVTGAAVMVASLFLPWYESPISNDLVLTAGAFGWAEAALVLIAGATTPGAAGRGATPPRPLREWALFVVRRLSAAVIVLYRTQTASLPLAGPREPYDLHYAIFVALAGAVSSLSRPEDAPPGRAAPAGPGWSRQRSIGSGARSRGGACPLVSRSPCRPRRVTLRSAGIRCRGWGSTLVPHHVRRLDVLTASRDCASPRRSASSSSAGPSPAS